MKYKYMRIQGRENSYITKYPKGIFSLCWNLIREDKFTDEEKELFINIDNWFKDNLPEPEPCKNHEINPAIALLDKYQKPYDVVYTNFVGSIVYEDNWQVAVQVEDGKII